MHDIPRIHIELEGTRRTIQAAFLDHDNDMSKMVQDSIEKTLTKGWVESEIQDQVNKMIRSAIEDITNNYELKRAISDLVANRITEVINGKK
jgi:hypothetical protein